MSERVSEREKDREAEIVWTKTTEHTVHFVVQMVITLSQPIVLNLGTHFRFSTNIYYDFIIIISTGILLCISHTYYIFERQQSHFEIHKF